MLGKLMKYEWKAVSGMNTLLAAIATGVSLLGILYLQTPVWKNYVNNGADSYAGGVFPVLWLILGIVGIFVYVVTLVGVGFGQTIYLGIRYYGSMFSDQGYLTHTLPVRSKDILLSKVTVAGCWALILRLLLALLTLVVILAGMCGIGDTSLSEVWEMLQEVYEQYGTETYNLFRADINAGFILTILSFLMSPFLSVAILFGALTLGHYSGKNKGFMGILAYFVVLFVRSLLNNLVKILLSALFFRLAKEQNIVWQFMLNGKGLSQLIVDIALAVGLMIWAHHIIENRLNME